MAFLSNHGVNMKTEYFHLPSIMKNTHVHTQYEVYFCPDDVSQRSVINGVEYSYKYPCVILSTPYTVHSMSCGENEREYERYVFYFSEKTLNAFNEHHLPRKMFKGTTGAIFKLDVQSAKTLKPLARLCHEAESVAEKELGFALFINKLLSVCDVDNIERIGTKSIYIQDVLQYISENFGGELSSDEIARLFSVSRSKLDRDFKRFTGLTVHGYVEICRLNQAKYLLESNGEMSVSEIAVVCGFENENYFFPFFKKKTGMTPAEYRKNIK